MKNYVISFILGVFGVFFLNSCSQKSEKEQKQETNEEKACRLFDQIFPFIALIEGDDGINGPYNDGSGTWTQIYGLTISPEGKKVQPTDAPLSFAEGKEWVKAHLEQHVFPFLKYFRPLSDEEIIGVSLFIYNIGGEKATGYTETGRERGEASEFMKAVNANKSQNECVNKMTGFRKSGGKFATGLLKRHWVQGGAFLGVLTAENILDLVPTKFYETKNLGNYYWLDSKRKLIEDRGFYQLRHDDITLNVFFNMNLANDGEKTVASILPN